MIPLPAWLNRLPLLTVVVLAFAGAAAPASANSAWFTRVWQTDDGLPNNQVTSIVQDREGFLWVGTAVGLARFDGVRFAKFPCTSFTNDNDQGVSEILPGRAGGLWLRMHNWPLLRLNPDFSQVAPAASGLPDARPVAALEDAAGCLWVAYADSIWQVKNGLAVQLTNQPGFSSGSLGRFVADSDGNVWLAKGNTVYVFRDGRFAAVASTPYKAHLAAARTNGVWIASGKQLFKCDLTGRLQDYGSFSAADLHTGATAVLEDHAGAVWIGTTSSGLFRRGESGFEMIETSHPDILCLAEDREENIWAGTAGGGLDRISTSGIELESPAPGSSLSAIQSVCEDTNGGLWGATQNGWLVARSDDSQWQQVFTNTPLPEAVTCVAAGRQGAVWIGTRDHRLYDWQGGQLTGWGTNNGFVCNLTVALLPVSNGDLWIAAEAPVVVQCLHDGQFRRLKLPGGVGRITALAEDAAGNIWAGSEQGNLLRAEGDALVNENSFAQSSGRSILCLCPAPDGTLWIGYEGAGLARLKDGHFNRIGAAQGLPDDYISQIVADDQGWFWFGGERGIFKIRGEQLAAVMDGQNDQVRPVGYGQNEGLSSMEANSVSFSPYVSPAAFRSHDGRLWIPLRKSLAAVDPRILRTDPEPPPALLSQVIMDGRVFASADGVAGTGMVANLNRLGAPLRMPPAHRHLEFDFTAINFSAPENLHFRYQLVGFDNDWIEARAERSAEYSRLTAGDYQFRVEASNGDGPWNETPTTLAFTVDPFFWQTWWFRVGVLLLFTSSVIAIVRYVSFRRLQAEMRRLEQHALLDKERTRIARDLHDDLGCSLNKVALTLDMTQRGLDSSESLNGKIQHCTTMVRQVARSVDEIVWAINPRNDTLRYMVDYISQFTVEFLHAAGISCRVDLPDHLPPRLVSPEARHNLFLVVKEALNNIARHAHATEVRLRITATDDQVAIAIEDNGRGFERAPDNASADGLRNMRQRMEEIGGRFKLDTGPGKGTRIAFLYSWPPHHGQ